MRPNKMRRRSAPTAYTWIAPVSLQDYPLDAGSCVTVTLLAGVARL